VQRNARWLTVCFWLLLVSLAAGAALAQSLGRGKRGSPPTPPPYEPTGSYETAFVDGSVRDPSRNRRIAYRLTYPRNFNGSSPLILLSHGTSGETDGYTKLAYLRLEYASHSYVVINVNHLQSKNKDQHTIDRPRDVSFLLNKVFAGAVAPPSDFQGALDLTNIGHAGHSWGALTSIALAGGIFQQGTNADPRIKAFCPLSPQGEDKFGSYDNGPNDNAWMNITAPMYNLVGAGEVDGDCNPREFVTEGWRLHPFERYPAYEAKYQSIIPEGCHYTLAGFGTPEQLSYAAENTRTFFDVYLKGLTELIPQIGQQAWIEGTEFDSKYDPPND